MSSNIIKVLANYTNTIFLSIFDSEEIESKDKKIKLRL